MIEIPLTKGLVAIVDDCDADLRDLRWHAMGSRTPGRFYAKRGCNVFIHRVVAERMYGIPLRGIVDHVNRDGLDNRRCNLRLASQGLNQANAKIRSDNKSGFRGVSWCKATDKWKAAVKQRYLGVFEDPREAARAYDAVAKQVFGVFATLNFPEASRDGR